MQKTIGEAGTTMEVEVGAITFLDNYLAAVGRAVTVCYSDLAIPAVHVALAALT
jgi:hypothetical protein